MTGLSDGVGANKSIGGARSLLSLFVVLLVVASCTSVLDLDGFEYETISLADNGAPCADGSECISGHCPAADGVCCETSCEDNCESCAGAKTGHTDGVCDFINPHTDPDNDCPLGGQSCDGSGSCLSDNGVACTTGTDCISGNCPEPESVCCDAACGDTCFGCTTSRTGLDEGICGEIVDETDPDSECPGNQNCTAGATCG